MESRKKVLSTIGIISIIVLLFGVTFAFFNYTRYGNDNVFRVGRIFFNTSQDGNINLTNVFPIKSDDLNDDVDNHDSVLITIEGDTNYSGGVEYLVTLTEVNNTINSKRIPITLNVTASNIGTRSDDTYFESRGGDSSIYKLYEDVEIIEDKYLLAGYIASGEDGIDGNIEITAYINADKIKISDTYNGTEDDDMGTSVEWAAGKVIFTTEEWNNFQSDPISFKVKVEANEGIWVEKEATSSKCFTFDYVPISTYNVNRTDDDINNCVNYLNNAGYNEYLQEGETLQDFCAGTGTLNGNTIQFAMANHMLSSSELIEIGIANVEYDATITGYDISCGTDVVIPRYLTSTETVIRSTYNENRTNDEINACVDYFEQLGIGEYLQEGETLSALCDGTGTFDGYNLQFMLDHGFFREDELSQLEEMNIISTTITNMKQSGKVTKIAAPSFDGPASYGVFQGKGLTSIVIPDTVTFIDRYTFKNNQLTSIEIPNSVTYIGKDAFAGNSISSMYIDMDSIPSEFLDNVGIITLDELTIGNSVTTINSSAFSSKQLTNVTIGNSVTTIESGAFNGNQLTSITIPNSVITIGNSAFGNNQITSVVIPNSVNTIDGIAFYKNQITSVVIPNSVTTIQQGAFSDNNIVSMSIDMTNIPNSFLNYLGSIKTLEELTIGNSVATIGDDAFSRNHLTNLTIGNNVTAIGNGAFLDNQLTSVTIPNSVTTIGRSAFSQNQLTNLTIGNNVTAIGNVAFSYNQLTSVEIPDSVTTIGEDAFYHNQLTSVEIPDSVTTIGVRAFANNQLTSVTIGNGLTTIEYPIFSNNNIVSMNIDMINIPNSFLDYLGSIRTLEELTIGSSVTTIGSSAFSQNKLTSLIIPNNVTTIGSSAFSRNKIASVTLPNNLTIIDDNVFEYNELTSVTIPNGVTSIGQSAFNRNQLTSVTIPNDVTSIGQMAFANNQLTGVTIGSSVTSIGAFAFYNNQLANVVIPNSVTTIGHNSFSDNILATVTFGNSVSSIGSDSFNGNQLTNVFIPNSLTFMDERAFYKDSQSNPNLTSITIDMPCSTITNMFHYDSWVNGSESQNVTIYGSNNEVCGTF